MAVNLSDKQIAKVKAIIDSVDVSDVTLLTVAAKSGVTLSDLKNLRKAFKKEILKIDKALALYGLDLAYDEAAAIMAKLEGKA